MNSDATASPQDRPKRVAVVGAGMVGLATAWFLQERGVEVTVLDRDGVAAGSSWGNAGWLTPGIATPLPEPAVLKYGVRAVLSPSSPVYVPPSANHRLLRFMAGFAAHSTMRSWKKAMTSLAGINRHALSSFDLLGAGGVRADTTPAKSFIAAYRTEQERTTLLEEIQHIQSVGQDMSFDVLSGDEARAVEPLLSSEIGAAILLHGQRYIDPGAYVHALADSVIDRGGKITSPSTVTGILDQGQRVLVSTTEGTSEEFDAVVLATGAWLGALARPFGVKRLVQAGRGYSFTVDVDHAPNGPVYLPAARVACTPLVDSSSGMGALRVAGMMEFRSPDAPLDQRRISAIAAAAQPLISGAHMDSRRDEWVGSRPVTTDGLPLVGATRSPRVYAAGGHGMWGVTLGPATGRLLAETIVSGHAPAELAPFNPLR